MEQLDDSAFTPFDIKYIQSILEQLNARKSVGMDNISSCLLRLSSPSISTEVTKLIDHFINTQSIPREWNSTEYYASIQERK